VTTTLLEQYPPKLAEILSLFQGVDAQDRNAMLLEFAEQLPRPTPELLRESPVPGQKVHECMTPVVLWAKREGDGITFFADIPDESPTIQAVASILIQGLDGLTPEEIASTPDHFPEIIFAGSPGARAFGMRGVLHQMQRLAQTV
jgi:cysteine desulfuration protein SufE